MATSLPPSPIQATLFYVNFIKISANFDFCFGWQRQQMTPVESFAA